MKTISEITQASILISSLPELPGYNGSILIIDDSEAERCEKSLYKVGKKLEEVKLVLEYVAEFENNRGGNWAELKKLVSDALSDL